MYILSSKAINSRKASTSGITAASTANSGSDQPLTSSTDPTDSSSKTTTNDSTAKAAANVATTTVAERIVAHAAADETESGRVVETKLTRNERRAGSNSKEAGRIKKE